MFKFSSNQLISVIVRVLEIRAPDIIANVMRVGEWLTQNRPASKISINICMQCMLARSLTRLLTYLLSYVYHFDIVLCVCWRHMQIITIRMTSRIIYRTGASFSCVKRNKMEFSLKSTRIYDSVGDCYNKNMMINLQHHQIGVDRMTYSHQALICDALKNVVFKFRWQQFEWVRNNQNTSMQNGAIRDISLDHRKCL